MRRLFATLMATALAFAPLTAGATCADECARDEGYLLQKRRAERGATGEDFPTMSANYCAALELAKCLLVAGCYQEAGEDTSTTRTMLEQLMNDNARRAADLGNSCDGSGIAGLPPPRPGFAPSERPSGMEPPRYTRPSAPRPSEDRPCPYRSCGRGAF